MDVFYVRNTRPNAVLVRLGERPHQTKYTVERRGSREDTTAFPKEALNDPTVARFIQSGIFEVITKEQFMSLGERNEGRSSIPLVTRKAETEVAIPMGDMETSRTPTIITDEDLTKTKDWRSPRPEFSGPILSTEQELDSGVIQPKDPEPKARPLSKDEATDKRVQSLEKQLADQAAQVDKLLALLSDTPPMRPDPISVPVYEGAVDEESVVSAFSAEELNSRTRLSLDSLARERGLKAPDKLPNKQAVIEAILKTT